MKPLYIITSCYPDVIQALERAEARMVELTTPTRRFEIIHSPKPPKKVAQWKTEKTYRNASKR